MIKSTLIKNVKIVNEGKIFKGDIRIKQDKIFYAQQKKRNPISAKEDG